MKMFLLIKILLSEQSSVSNKISSFCYLRAQSNNLLKDLVKVF